MHVLTNVELGASSRGLGEIRGLSVLPSTVLVAIGSVNGSLGSGKVMTKSFDYSKFNRGVGIMRAEFHGLAFDDRVKRIEAIRAEFADIGDSAARLYVEQSIDRMMLESLIDTRQPFSVVYRCFQQIHSRGFSSQWAAVFSTIEYAEFCTKHHEAEEGLRRLRDAKVRLAGTAEKMPKGLKQQLSRQLNMFIRRLEKATGSSDHNP